MAFLVINGWTVPAALGGTYTPTECADRDMAFDGTPLLTMTGHKRRWTFESTRLLDVEAEGLIGMLQGKGDKFVFDEDLWSDQGDYPSGTPVATITPNVGADGNPVYDEVGGAREAKYGDGSLWMGPSTSNLLSVDSSNAENGVAGFSSLNGATLAVGSADSVYLAGSNSIKTTSVIGGNSGFQTTFIGSVSIAAHTGSVNVYATSAITLRLRLNDTGGTFATKDFTTIANGWVRAEVSGTPTTGSNVRIQLYHPPAAVVTWYTDQLQIEQVAYATPWIVGQSSRSAPSLDYGDICSKSDSLTFAAWVRAPTTNPSASAYIFETVSASPTNRVVFYRRSGNNDLALYVKNGASSSAQTFIYSSSPWDDDWHHVAFVLSSGSGGKGAKIYYDGTAVYTNTSVTRYPFLRGTQTTCYIGNRNGSNSFDGRISEVLILPFAMSDGQIAALAARTTALPQHPKLEALGDFNMATDYQPEVVEGVVTGVGYDGSVKDSSWQNNNRIVSFALDSEKDI